VRSDNNLFKIFAVGFLLALIVYIASFSFIQRQREHNGPWLIVFQTDADNRPSIVISHTNLHIEPHTISFPEAKGPRPDFLKEIHFNGPITNVPFGEIVFQDPTFLPGTVMFNFWGHGVELMPRTMIIDQQEVPWHSKTNLTLTGEGKFERRKVKKPAFL
jgi:hypothetical protein